MPRRLPGNPCEWRWDSTARIYQVIGAQVRGKKLPKTLHGRFKVDGWTIVVKRGGGSGRTAKTRMFVDFDGRLVPAGRVRQALCRHNVHRSRKKAAAQRGPGGRFVWRRR